MTYKTVIIGLGVIARYHAVALRASERFRLVAVCDLRNSAAEDSLYSSLPFYSNYEDLLDTVRPDVAIITTPPAAHLAITQACITRGVLPIVEKPLAASADEGQQFFTTALRGKYVPVCHTLYGPEMLWLAQNKPQHIDSIHMELYDPYADSVGHIEKRYISLGGSWLDSAPNALAPLMRIIPDLNNVHVTHLRDEALGLPYASSLRAQHNNTSIAIDIAWNKGINHKQTTLIADGKHFLINHSAQTIIIDGEQVFAAQGDRLTEQYTNFYQLYPARVPTTEMTKSMYQIIFSNL